MTPVRTSAEALVDPDLRARGVLEDVALADGRTATAARPVAWLPADGRALGAPALGAHTDEVLRSIGAGPGLLG